MALLSPLPGSQAVARPLAQGEFSCNFDNEIWNNSESDPAVLIDPSG